MKPMGYGEARERLIMEGVTREARNAALWKTLKHFVPASVFPPRSSNEEQVQILGVACGAAEEVVVLTAYFSTGVYGLPSSRARFIGVEKDKTYVDYAREITQNPTVSGGLVVLPLAEFYAGDATDLSSIKGVPKEADIIFLRHPHVRQDGPDRVWFRIVGQCLKHLKPGGIFMVTVFHERENEILKKMLEESVKSHGAKILKNALNPHAIALNAEPGFMGDKWVTLVTRGD